MSETIKAEFEGLDRMAAIGCGFGFGVTEVKRVARVGNVMEHYVARLISGIDGAVLGEGYAAIPANAYWNAILDAERGDERARDRAAFERRMLRGGE